MVTQANIVHLQETSSEVAWLYLLEITPPAGPVLRLVNNIEPITSRGNVYQPYPFRLVLPDQQEGQLPKVKIEIDVIAGEIIEAVRGFAEPPSFKVELISTAYPDIPEKTLDFLKLRAVTYDAMILQADMEVVNILSAKFPFEEYDPVSYPALFY